jgi:hypothetical protein
MSNPDKQKYTDYHRRTQEFQKNRADQTSEDEVVITVQTPEKKKFEFKINKTIAGIVLLSLLTLLAAGGAKYIGDHTETPTPTPRSGCEIEHDAKKALCHIKETLASYTQQIVQGNLKDHTLSVNLSIRAHGEPVLVSGYVLDGNDTSSAIRLQEDIKKLEALESDSITVAYSTIYTTRSFGSILPPKGKTTIIDANLEKYAIFDVSQKRTNMSEHVMFVNLPTSAESGITYGYMFNLGQPKKDMWTYVSPDGRFIYKLPARVEDGRKFLLRDHQYVASASQAITEQVAVNLVYPEKKKAVDCEMASHTPTPHPIAIADTC